MTDVRSIWKVSDVSRIWKVSDVSRIWKVSDVSRIWKVSHCYMKSVKIAVIEFYKTLQYVSTRVIWYRAQCCYGRQSSNTQVSPPTVLMIPLSCVIIPTPWACGRDQRHYIRETIHLALNL